MLIAVRATRPVAGAVLSTGWKDTIDRRHTSMFTEASGDLAARDLKDVTQRTGDMPSASSCGVND